MEWNIHLRQTESKHENKSKQKGKKQMKKEIEKVNNKALITKWSNFISTHGLLKYSYIFNQEEWKYVENF